MRDPNASHPPAPAGHWQSAVRGLGGGLGAGLVFSFALNLLMLAVPLYSLQMLWSGRRGRHHRREIKRWSAPCRSQTT
jgi:hypothetical protein